MRITGDILESPCAILDDWSRRVLIDALRERSDRDGGATAATVFVLEGLLPSSERKTVMVRPPTRPASRAFSYTLIEGVAALPKAEIAKDLVEGLQVFDAPFEPPDSNF